MSDMVYALQWVGMPLKLPLFGGDLGPHVICGFLGHPSPRSDSISIGSAVLAQLHLQQ